MIRLVVTALCAGLAVGPPQAPAVALPSVVFVDTSWQGWVRDTQSGEVFGGTRGYRFTTSCSGAVVAGDGLVVTAAQCVDAGTDRLLDLAVADLAAVGRVRDRALARQQLAEHAVTEGVKTGSPVARHVRVTLGHDVGPAIVGTVAGDLAVLQVPRGGLPALEVASGDVPVGASVFVLGRPADGSAPTSASARVVGRDGAALQLSAPTPSGGPVVDTRGRLVGVATRDATVTGPAAVAGLLRDKHIGLGPVDRDFRTGLDAYFAGDYDKAVEYLDAVHAATPANEQARRYRDLAAARGGTAPGGGLLLASLVAAALVATASGGAVIVLANRRRRAMMDTPPYGFRMEPLP